MHQPLFLDLHLISLLSCTRQVASVQLLDWCLSVLFLVFCSRREYLKRNMHRVRNELSKSNSGLNKFNVLTLRRIQTLDNSVIWSRQNEDVRHKGWMALM